MADPVMNLLPDNERDWWSGDMPRFTMVMLGDDGVTLITLAAIVSFKLTFWNQATGKKINGRNLQNVLNTNNVTVGATNGTVNWILQPADMAMQSNDLGVLEEDHVFRFDLVYTDAVYGQRQKSYQDFYRTHRLVAAK